MTALQFILTALTQAPALWAQLKPIYDSIAGSFSPEDQAAIEAAFEKAKADDAAQTAQTDADLSATEKE